MWLCRRRNKQNLFGDFGQLPRRTPRGGSIDGAHAAHRAARSPSKTEILYDSPDRGALRVWRLYLRTVGLGAAPTAGAVGSAALSPSPRSGEALSLPLSRQSSAKGGKSAECGSPEVGFSCSLPQTHAPPAPKSPNLIRGLTLALNAGRFLCRGRGSSAAMLRRFVEPLARLLSSAPPR